MPSIAPKPNRAFIALITCALLTSAARAATGQIVTFTFEEFDPAATGGRGSTYTSLTSTVDDVSITIARENTDTFDIFDSTSTARPASWGSRSLSPFANQQSTNAFIVNLSSLATAASIEFGDYGDGFDLVTFQAWSGPDATGTKLDERIVVWGSRNLAFDSALTAAVDSIDGIASLRIIGGATGFPHSVYYDNLTLTIPAPGAACVISLGALAIARRRRR